MDGGNGMTLGGARRAATRLVYLARRRASVGNWNESTQGIFLLRSESASDQSEELPPPNRCGG